MTGRDLRTSTAEPGRFVLTLAWPGETDCEQASVGLDVLDAARLRDALSLWLAGVEEAALRRAVEAWHASQRRDQGRRRTGRRRRMNYDDFNAAGERFDEWRVYPGGGLERTDPHRLVRQVTFTEAHESPQVIEARPVGRERRDDAAAAQADCGRGGVSRAVLRILADAAALVVLALVVAVVWRWLT